MDPSHLHLCLNHVDTYLTSNVVDRNDAHVGSDLQIRALRNVELVVHHRIFGGGQFVQHVAGDPHPVGSDFGIDFNVLRTPHPDNRYHLVLAALDGDQAGIVHQDDGGRLADVEDLFLAMVVRGPRLREAAASKQPRGSGE